MYIWPDDMELLRLNSAGDKLVLKQTFNSNLAFGDPGAGKSSGFGAHVFTSLLRAKAGGFATCSKQTDFRDYMKIISREGRQSDVIWMKPSAHWNEKPINRINILDLELNRFGRGRVNIESVTSLLQRVSELIQRQKGQGSAGEPFWAQFAEMIIRAGLTGQSIVTNTIDLKSLLRFVQTLPNTPLEVEEQSVYSVALMEEAKAILGDDVPYDFTLAYDFVTKGWLQSAPNTRGSGALTVATMLNTLLSHPLRQMLFEDTTFDLDQVLSRQGILLLDMDVHNYAQGAVAGMILKDVIQRACQTRPELETYEPRFVQPVFQLIDEYHNYAVDDDEKHALMARSSRSIPIYISQSLPSILSRFFNKDKAKSQLEVAGCRWIHQTGSSETAEWMSKAIGQVLVKREGQQTGRTWSYGPNNQDGRNQGRNYTEQLEFDCPPRAFGRLLRGGPENGLRTEAIYWGSGDKFKFNGRRWLPCVFPQDFRPGRDEVRITAIQKGGNNRAS